MLTKIYKYNHELNSYDVIKFIAIIVMIIDHTGYYFIEDNDYWRAIGRLAAPLFFFITGYVSNYKIKLNIVIYGIVITILTFYVKEYVYINILIVFVSIKWILNRWTPEHNSTFTLVIIFLLLCFTSSFSKYFIEYGFFGFAYALCGRLMATKAKLSLANTFIGITFFIQVQDIILYHEDNYIRLTVLIIGIILFLITFSFKYQIFNTNPFVKNSILILSRYSLEIYFWHLLLFELVKYSMMK